MAERGVYGRSGVAVGGKGGVSLHEAYSYGPKDTSQYLTGGLGAEYASSKSTMNKDLSVYETQTGKGSRETAQQLHAKKKAKQNIGRLREIAGATAVGDFLDFANTKGRGSKARASKGLLTGESYAPGP